MFSCLHVSENLAPVEMSFFITEYANFPTTLIEQLLFFYLKSFREQYTTTLTRGNSPRFGLQKL